MTTSDRRSRSVKLFVRGDPEPGTEARKRHVLERLSELQESGRLTEFEVHVWTKRICPSGPLRETTFHRTVLDTLREFRNWAERTGRSVDCAFKQHETHSVITGEEYSTISLPMMCLAVYEDGALSGVYPHSTDAGVRTIQHVLEQLTVSDDPFE
jgi:hypothetical protein